MEPHHFDTHTDCRSVHSKKHYYDKYEWKGKIKMDLTEVGCEGVDSFCLLVLEMTVGIFWTQ
jgi:hypothetical protein